MEQKTHWKKLGDPRFLGEPHFTEGEEKTLTIKEIKNEEVFEVNSKSKQVKRTAAFYETKLMMVLNTTNSERIAKLYKSDYIEDWIGKRITIYFDKTVKVGREQVGGLRVKNIIPAPQKLKLNCVICNEPIKGFDNYTAEQIAKHTYQKYGKELCSKCAEQEKRLIEEAEKSLSDKILNELGDDENGN